MLSGRRQKGPGQDPRRVGAAGRRVEELQEPEARGVGEREPRRVGDIAAGHARGVEGLVHVAGDPEQGERRGAGGQEDRQWLRVQRSRGPHHRRIACLSLLSILLSRSSRRH